MPQQIDVPGMGLIEFPDGMNDAAISAAIKKSLAAGSTGSQVEDVGKGLASGAVGVASGMAGLPGDVQGLLEKAGNKMLAPGAPPVAAPFRLPGAGAIKSKIEELTGPIPEPTTLPGKLAKTGVEFGAGALFPGGPVRRAMNVAAPLAGAEIADVATGGNPYAKAVGALAGGVAVPRAITPFPASPERARLVNILGDEGVTSLTAGQRSGSPALRYAESTLGDFPGAGGAATRVQQEGQRQFTEAATRRSGGGPTATPEALADNQARLGNEFQTLAARNNLNFDQQFIQDATQAVRQYQRVPPSQQRAIVEGYVDDIVQHVQQGQMPGPAYQEMRSRLSRQANNLRESDPTLSEALRDLRNSLDNAMRRSISPADAEAWDTARRQYGAQKTIETAASRAGEATAEGQIVPANLRNAVSAQNRGAYARGEGDFSELARAGAGIMAPLPQSGTTPRAIAAGMTSGIGAGGAAFLGGGPMELSAASVGGAVAPALAGRALMSSPVQGYLGNQLLPTTRAELARRLTVQELLARPEETRR